MKSNSLLKKTRLLSIIRSEPGGEIIQNAFFMFIGLVLPGMLVVQSLYHFQWLPFEPQLYYLFIAIPGMLPLGALLYLLGLRGDRKDRFALVMLFLFGYGFFLALIVRAIFIIIAQLVLYYFVSRENIFLITDIGSTLIIAFLDLYAIWYALTLEASGSGSDYSPSSTPTTKGSGFGTAMAAYEVLADDSADSSDRGGDD